MGGQIRPSTASPRLCQERTTLRIAEQDPPWLGSLFVVSSRNQSELRVRSRRCSADICIGAQVLEQRGPLPSGAPATDARGSMEEGGPKETAANPNIKAYASCPDHAW